MSNTWLKIKHPISQGGESNHINSEWCHGSTLFLLAVLLYALFSSLHRAFIQLSWHLCIPIDCWNQSFTISLLPFHIRVSHLLDDCLKVRCSQFVFMAVYTIGMATARRTGDVAHFPAQNQILFLDLRISYLNPRSVMQLGVCVVRQETLDRMWILHFFHILPFKIYFLACRRERLNRLSSVFLHLQEKHLSASLSWVL